MDKRLELHELLCNIVNITEPDGNRHVYFDPPMDLQIKYPAIIYSRGKIGKVYANNAAYNLRTPYEIIVIDKRPDNPVIDALLELPYSSYDRHYNGDNLNHDVITLYF